MSDEPVTREWLTNFLSDFLNNFKKEINENIDAKLEKINTKIESMEKKIDSMDKRIHTIEGTLKTVQGFQSNESHAIEFELRQILEKYLYDNFPRKKLNDFPLKSINDPYTNKTITDFDAAFYLSDYIFDSDDEDGYNKEYNQAYNQKYKEAKSIITKTNRTIMHEQRDVFILAEAKHYINFKKIRSKLKQFDIICKILNIVRSIYKSENPAETAKSMKIHPKFLDIIGQYDGIHYISKYILLFGAAYWEGKLIDKLKPAVNEYKYLIHKFSRNREKKIAFYKAICKIEENWYDPENLPNDPNLSDEKIMELKSIDGALAHVEFIFPSGDRFHIEGSKVIQGLWRGGKTRRK
jgi:hypothetical protein